MNDPASVAAISVDPTRVPADVAVREGFAEFYGREHRAVMGLAFVLTGRRCMADDLAQDAFVSAYRRWDSIATYDDPGAWVRRVVANQAVSVYRRTVSEAKALVLLRRGSEPQAEVADRTEELWRAVRRLPRRQAQAIVLKYVDGRNVGDIARILNCSENTVKTHLARARQKLAIDMRQESDDD